MKTLLVVGLMTVAGHHQHHRHHHYHQPQLVQWTPGSWTCTVTEGVATVGAPTPSPSTTSMQCVWVPAHGVWR